MADETRNDAPAGSAPAEGGGAPSGAPQGQRPQGGPREGGRGPRPGGPGRDGGRKFFRRKKVCKFCVEKIDAVDYKDVRLLGQFVSPESGKIVPRRLTGVCTPHQRRVSD